MPLLISPIQPPIEKGLIQLSSEMSFTLVGELGRDARALEALTTPQGDSGMERLLGYPQKCEILGGAERTTRGYPREQNKGRV